MENIFEMCWSVKRLLSCLFDTLSLVFFLLLVLPLLFYFSSKHVGFEDLSMLEVGG